MEGSQHELKGRSVYILQIRQQSGQYDPIPFAQEHDLQRHLCDLISRQLDRLDEKLRRPIILGLEMKDYLQVIRLYRSAQLNNSQALPMDFRWEERTSVIM